MAETMSPAVQARTDYEIAGFRYLLELAIADDPQTYRNELNRIVYNEGVPPYLLLEGNVNAKGLPTGTDESYTREGIDRSQVIGQPPKVLNIGSGADEARKLMAVNLDVSDAGQPDIVADARSLPIADGTLTALRASHVLEHIPQDQIVSTLEEWRRVLHTDGFLHIAVPDAITTFKALVKGVTHRGQPAYSLEQDTVPLAQLYGLGYENPQTDPRWAHRIIFNYKLLEFFLRQAGFNHVVPRTRHEDLAHLCGVDDDSQNNWTLLVTASREAPTLPENVDQPMDETQYRTECRTFRQQSPENPDTTFIIPVADDGENLRLFLTSLQVSGNETATEREFIFVLGDASPDTEATIARYLREGSLRGKIVYNRRDDGADFRVGIEQRELGGFIGKLDVDGVLHAHALDLMQMHLVQHPEIVATYAEAMADIPVRGRSRGDALVSTCLYRDNPYATTGVHEVPAQTSEAGIFMSYFYAYFRGLDSVRRAPHALTYGNNSFGRSGRGDLARVYKAAPHLSILDRLMHA